MEGATLWERNPTVETCGGNALALIRLRLSAALMARQGADNDGGRSVGPCDDSDANEKDEGRKS